MSKLNLTKKQKEKISKILFALIEEEYLIKEEEQDGKKMIVITEKEGTDTREKNQKVNRIRELKNSTRILTDSEKFELQHLRSTRKNSKIQI